VSQTVGLDDELLSAATAAFLAHPDTLAPFVTAMSAIFIEGQSLACSPSPLFVDQAVVC
jgi:hypothetical protein